MAALSRCNPAGDQMSDPKRLGQLSFDRQRADHALRPRLIHTDPLNVELCQRLDGRSPLQEAPLLTATWHVLEQGTANCFEIGLSPADRQYRKIERCAQLRKIYDVEAGKGDTLKEYGVKLRPESAPLDQPTDHLGRVDAIAPDSATQHPLQTITGKYRSHHEHIAPVTRTERGVVEPHDVRHARGRLTATAFRHRLIADPRRPGYGAP